MCTEREQSILITVISVDHLYAFEEVLEQYREFPNSHHEIRLYWQEAQSTTYVEYSAVSGVFQNIDPPPPLHTESVSSPPDRRGGFLEKSACPPSRESTLKILIQ